VLEAIEMIETIKVSELAIDRARSTPTEAPHPPPYAELEVPRAASSRSELGKS